MRQKESEVNGKIEKDRGVGSSGSRKKLEEVDRSGQNWEEMKILDLCFKRSTLSLSGSFSFAAFS